MFYKSMTILRLSLSQRSGWICAFAAVLVGALFLVAGVHKVLLVTKGGAGSDSGLNGAFTAFYGLLQTSGLPRANPAIILIALGSLELLFGVSLIVVRKRRAVLFELAALLLACYALGLAMARPYLQQHGCGCTGVSFVDGQSALWAIVRNSLLIGICLSAASIARRLGPTIVATERQFTWRHKVHELSERSHP